MPEWSLTDIPPGEALRGIAGYAVLGGLGLQLGQVTGWVKDPDAQVRMIKVAVRAGYETKEYLVPIGSVTLIDDGRSQIHLRELTKRSLPKFCTKFDGELQEPRLLKSLIRFFPNPRPSVVERLEDPDTAPPPSTSPSTSPSISNPAPASASPTALASASGAAPTSASASAAPPASASAAPPASASASAAAPASGSDSAPAPATASSLPDADFEGDGANLPSRSVLEEGPEWIRLEHLAHPSWTSLSTFSAEVSQRQ